MEPDLRALEMPMVEDKIAPRQLLGETLMENHEPFLREAIALSKSAMDRGDEPFGSVLVREGAVILRAENSVFTGHDMTNHAEMNLIKTAAQHYDTAFLAGCTLYTSTEPCAPGRSTGRASGAWCLRARKRGLARSPGSG